MLHLLFSIFPLSYMFHFFYMVFPHISLILLLLLLHLYLYYNTFSLIHSLLLILAFYNIPTASSQKIPFLLLISFSYVHIICIMSFSSIPYTSYFYSLHLLFPSLFLLFLTPPISILYTSYFYIYFFYSFHLIFPYIFLLCSTLFIVLFSILLFRYHNYLFNSSYFISLSIRIFISSSIRIFISSSFIIFISSFLRIFFC